MRLPNPGTRIVLAAMSDDPDPIPPGTGGTVRHASVVDFLPGTEPYVQIAVEWDNGRTLGLCVPPDRYELETT